MGIIAGAGGGGGFLAGVFPYLEEPTSINVGTIVVSVIGAIIVVFVAYLVMGTGHRRGTA